MTKPIPAHIPLTGTGLDDIVLAIVNDTGLNTALNPARQAIREAETLTGAEAAAELNGLISGAIKATGVAADGRFTVDDVRTINAHLRADAATLERFTIVHGDDEGGVETGFHLVQSDGAVTQFRGLNLVNKVADGLYHIAFEIQGDHFVNEDGNANAPLQSVADWLNFFYLGLNEINGTSKADVLRSGPSDDLFAGAENEVYRGYGGNDTVKAGDGNDTAFGGTGNDTISGDMGDDILNGEDGADNLIGGQGADRLTGGRGADRMDAGRDASADTFVFQLGDAGAKPAQFDRIQNFKSGQDKIDLTGLGHLAFGGDRFDAHGPEVIVRGATVLADIDGDGGADFGIQLLGNVKLVEADFIL